MPMKKNTPPKKSLFKKVTGNAATFPVVKKTI